MTWGNCVLLMSALGEKGHGRSLTSYTFLLGRHVELVYRFRTIELLALGVLLVCADNSIVLEQHADQYGNPPRFQLKIPLSWIIRLNADCVLEEKCARDK
jgi:hypothetical protein